MRDGAVPASRSTLPPRRRAPANTRAARPDLCRARPGGMSARRSGPGTDIAERDSRRSRAAPAGAVEARPTRAHQAQPSGVDPAPRDACASGPNASTFRWWREGARRPGATGPSGGPRLSTRAISAGSRCVRQRSAIGRGRSRSATRLVRAIVSLEYGPIVVGSSSTHCLVDGRIEGEDPLSPFSPNAPAHPRRTTGSSTSPTSWSTACMPQPRTGLRIRRADLVARRA